MTPTKEEARSERLPVQFGSADSADFEEGTWTFFMDGSYRVAAGDFAILPRATYEQLVAAAPLSPAGQAVRMLTEDEAQDAYSLMDGDASFLDRDPTWMDRINAVMFKFCEVSGLAVGQPAGREVPEVVDRGPWVAQKWSDGRVVLQSDDFTHDVALIVNGDFADDAQHMEYASGLAEQINRAVLAAGLPVQGGEVPLAEKMADLLEWPAAFLSSSLPKGGE